ncbi:MAG: tRNA (guanosine(37)-N1)-methyltransferase TrmD [Deltaproteobacteria bacterium]|nr:tRNA (guanosine(37)-N1)-methyltransferase TrmD [Deltaproteobacteria bacterium]
MRFDVLTLLPEFFESPLKQGVLGRSIKSGLVEVGLTNIRDYSSDLRRNVDAAPYGGGAGMVLKVEPVVKAIEDLKSKVGGGEKIFTEIGVEGRMGVGSETCNIENEKGISEVLKGGEVVIMLTPQGAPLTQKKAQELSSKDRIIILCGRYEGFDERIREFVDEEISIGDFVLSGGEAAALVLIDSIGRLVPGVLGDKDSLDDESFSEARDGLLEYPQYTRPEEFRSMRVPKVLTSGNHKEINEWRRRESIKRTKKRRPDLIEDVEEG